MRSFSITHFPIALISLILWLPIGSLCLLLLTTKLQARACRYIALGTVILQGLGMGYILYGGLTNIPLEKYPWIHFSLYPRGTLSIDYLIGIDGLNAGIISLTLFILTIGIIASWNIQQHPKIYFALYLLMDTLLMGIFLSLNFLVFYIFLEAVLIPIYFFMHVWGDQQHTHTVNKFLIYNLLGTMMILMVLIGLGQSVYDPVATGMRIQLFEHHEIPSASQIKSVQHLVQTQAIDPQHIVHTLNITCMTNKHNFIPGSIFDIQHGQYFWGTSARLFAFLGLLIGCLIKLGIVPFHNWLPDSHATAPTPISMILAAILLKIGSYSIIRMAYHIFPEGANYYAVAMGSLGVCTLLYASLIALTMKDLKRMVAYSSIAHMGFLLLGLSSLTHVGLQGALYQMVSHGLIATLLFGIVGVLQDRTQERDLHHYSGLATVMPYYTVIVVFSFFDALGLPGGSSFMAKLLILMGTFQSPNLPNWLGIAGTIGILLNASYWIWTLQRTFLGVFTTRNPSWRVKLSDLTTREYILLIPLLISTLFLGVYPQCLWQLTESAVDQLVTYVHTTGKENLTYIAP